jgi:16S rRNA (cytidine1402-2'-O)-methyltransferase
VLRAPLGELAEWAQRAEVRGEITVVVAGRTATAERGQPDEAAAGRWAAEVADAESGGLPRKEAIASVAVAHGVAKRAVYDAVVAAKRRV